MLLNGVIKTPNLMIDVLGDFAAEVCISPISDEIPQIGGFLIWNDQYNYLRFERDFYGQNEMTFHGCVDKNLRSIGRGYLQTDETGLVHLRLERKDNLLSAYCSLDGENWMACGKVTLPLDNQIKIGITANGLIHRGIYCGEYKEGTATLFRNFRIWTK